MWSFGEKQNLHSLSDMYPDRTNLNCVGPSYYEFTYENRLYNKNGCSCLRNYNPK